MICQKKLSYSHYPLLSLFKFILSVRAWLCKFALSTSFFVFLRTVNQLEKVVTALKVGIEVSLYRSYVFLIELILYYSILRRKFNLHLKPKRKVQHLNWIGRCGNKWNFLWLVLLSNFYSFNRKTVYLSTSSFR